ncbi:MAG TPA: DUF2019 domain-containing protein [Reyranella sp.]|jgi:hypothetical protein|nr:DUF2019 domain-containing protein [Reyranella sp.]
MMDPEDRYIAEATEHGRCTESGDYKRGNSAYDRMIAALAELRGHADRGEAVLTKLLNHPNEWVRLDAATHLLPLRAELASANLENLASGPQSQLEFVAKMVLREWRAGRLNVP